MLRALLFIVRFVKFSLNQFISMKLITSFLSVAVATTLLLGGCKGKDGDPGPAGATGATGPSGQNLSGNIVGFVNPVDEDGNPVSKSGVAVTVLNTNPQLVQTTDANGRYEFANLSSGTYNFSFSRPDIGLYKTYGFAHVGGDQPSFANLRTFSTISRTVVISATASAPMYNPTFGNYVPVTVSLYSPSASNSQSPYRRVVLYASTTPGVTAATGTFVREYYIYTGGGSNDFQVTRAEMNAAGFTSGTPVYGVLYGAPYYYNTSYTDIVTGRTVYPGLNMTGSQPVSFFVP